MKKSIILFLNKVIGIIRYKQKQIEILKLKYLPNTFVGDYFYVGSGTYFDLDKNFQKLEILNNVVAKRHCSFFLGANATLAIGNKVFFNNYCSVNALGSINIGDNTMFGEGVKIYDHNHLYNWNKGKLDIARDDFNIGSVRIGKDCWIGSNVTILNNVEIGDNVIVGANCLVFKSVPSNSIVKSRSELIIIGATAQQH
jgi:acetyltransferase-like isoleucine patch superfamily enzyme